MPMTKSLTPSHNAAEAIVAFAACGDGLALTRRCAR
jgi:hypothetical protein